MGYLLQLPTLFDGRGAAHFMPSGISAGSYVTPVVRLALGHRAESYVDQLPVMDEGSDTDILEHAVKACSNLEAELILCDLIKALADCGCDALREHRRWCYAQYDAHSCPLPDALLPACITASKLHVKGNHAVLNSVIRTLRSTASRITACTSRSNGMSKG